MWCGGVRRCGVVICVCKVMLCVVSYFSNVYFGWVTCRCDLVWYCAIRFVVVSCHVVCRGLVWSGGMCCVAQCGVVCRFVLVGMYMPRSSCCVVCCGMQCMKYGV